MGGECWPTNGRRGGLASTSPQPAETAGGESCSFSGFNHYYHHDDEEEGDDEDVDEDNNDDDDEEEGDLDGDYPDPPHPFFSNLLNLIDPHQQSSG